MIAPVSSDCVAIVHDTNETFFGNYLGECLDERQLACC